MKIVRGGLWESFGSLPAVYDWFRNPGGWGLLFMSPPKFDGLAQWRPAWWESETL